MQTLYMLVKLAAVAVVKICMSLNAGCLRILMGAMVLSGHLVNCGV